MRSELRAAVRRDVSALMLLGGAFVLCLGATAADAQTRKPRPTSKQPTRKAQPRQSAGARPADARTATTSSTAQGARPAAGAGQKLSVRTEPQAVVWLDEVRRGVTDAAGQLELERIAAGRHTLRVRASGFAERTLPLTAAQRGVVAVKLVRTTDAAELAFQQAETAREQATSAEARRAAVELYRRALDLRPRYAAAHVGLARLLLDLNETDAAFDEIEAARAARPVYPEAGAVEGRILREQGDAAAAIAAFQRAVREGRGFQPEAYTGLGLALEDKGRYEEAAAAFTKAIAQLADTEPVLYELLGRTYERLDKYKEAVAAYEKYLQLAPDGKLAPAIRSIIEQLRQQASGADIPLPPPGL
ncbi:MAG TPA: tetratricopeptide repeat protein [Pyrinomonadaceae bacterium]|jgi:Tfp pilus assembly protein PilF